MQVQVQGWQLGPQSLQSRCFGLEAAKGKEALSFEGSALANAWRCHQGLPHLGLLSVQQQSGEQRDSGRKKLAGECAFPGMTGGAPGSRHVRAVGNVSLAGF